MATRFYLPASGSAPVTPALGTQWTITAGWTAHPTKTTKSNTALANGTARTNGSVTALTDRLDRVFVSDQLNAQTISGTFSAVIQCMESDALHNAWFDIVLRVVSADGQTQRGVLYAGSTASTSSATVSAENGEMVVSSTTPATRIKSAIALTSVAAQAGDRLVIEIGYRKQTATSYTATLRYGDPTTGADATLTAGTTTATVLPWVELSGDLAFAPLTNRAARFSGDTTGWRLTTNTPGAPHTMCAFVYLEVDRNAYSTLYEVSSGQATYVQCGTGADGVSLGAHMNGGGADSATALVVGAWWKFVQVITPTQTKLRAAPLGTALTESQVQTLVAYPATAVTMAFGYSPAWTGEFFNGRMAGMKLWSAELSLAECDAEFTQYRAIRTADLIGEYTQWSGPSTADTSGLGRTLVAAPGAAVPPADAAGPPGIPLTGGTPAPIVTATNHFHTLAAA